MTRRASLLALMALLGCGRDTVTATQTMVRIDAQTHVRASLQEVRLVVRSGQGEMGKWEDRYDRKLSPDAKELSWPIEFSILPKNGDATRVYEVTATALDASGEEIAQVRAISGFVAHKALTLALRFDDACIGRVTACDENETCRAGDCVDAHVDATLLPLYTPGTRSATTSDAGQLAPFDGNGMGGAAGTGDHVNRTDGGMLGVPDGSSVSASDGGGGGTSGLDAASPISCSGGETDCGGKCIDLQSDPENCGKCGLACRAMPGDAATCDAGECPVVTALLTATDNPATSIAVDAVNLYWGTSYSANIGLEHAGEIATVPITGGAPKTLANMTPVFNLVVDGDVLFVCMRSGTSSSSNVIVATLGVEGGTPTSVSSGTSPSSSVAAADGAAYWISGSSVYRRGPGDTAPVALNTNTLPTTGTAKSIAVRGGNVFWVPSDSSATADAIWRVATDGGLATKLADISKGGASFGIALDDANVYWTSSGSGGTSGTISKVSVSGGTPETIASGQSNPQAVATDGKSVYWLNVGTGTKTGSLWKVSVDGGTPVELASGLDGPVAIAIDETAVYWSEASGLMMRSPR